MKRRREAREAQAAGELAGLRHWAAGTSGADLVHVEHVYQRARRGTKAVVIHDATGQRRDAWFWWFSNLSTGELVAVAASSGWGPHNNIRDVLYVGSETRGHGVYVTMPHKKLLAASRHARRVSASS